MLRILNISFQLLVFCNCNGQDTTFKNYTEFKVGIIPDLISFEKMTQREIDLDTMMARYQKESLQGMEDGTAFIKETTEEDKSEAIADWKIKYTKYNENRSRYFFETFVNEKKDDKEFSDIDTITTDCGCYLSGDTIKIGIGIWVFGGFGFSIDLVNNKFISCYWVDKHERNVYKANFTDTSLDDNVVVDNIDQSLTLFENPNYKLGEEITGYLVFKTKKYYRSSDFEHWSAKDIPGSSKNSLKVL
ncbi:MAG: hypothetical protein ABI861_09250 [Panacibacter sp.]